MTFTEELNTSIAGLEKLIDMPVETPEITVRGDKRIEVGRVVFGFKFYQSDVDHLILEAMDRLAAARVIHKHLVSGQALSDKTAVYRARRENELKSDLGVFYSDLIAETIIGGEIARKKHLS